jgi:hypothetical protein
VNCEIISKCDLDRRPFIPEQGFRPKGDSLPLVPASDQMIRTLVSYNKGAQGAAQLGLKSPTAGVDAERE